MGAVLCNSARDCRLVSVVLGGNSLLAMRINATLSSKGRKVTTFVSSKWHSLRVDRIPRNEEEFLFSETCGGSMQHRETTWRNDRVSSHTLCSSHLVGTGATLNIGSSTPRASRVPVQYDGYNSEVNQREKSPLSWHPRRNGADKRAGSHSRNSEMRRGAFAHSPRSLFRWTFILFGEEQVLRSGAKSQRIAVWWLLYHLQHSGQYLSRLQTDWLTHDVASVSMFDSGIPPMAIMAMRAERSTARA